jgi:uncharacterized protein (DUF305 family)
MRSRFAVLLTAATLLSACAPERPPEPAEAMSHDLPATDGPGFTAADVRFMQGMISHHAQAIRMAEMAPTHGAGEQLLKLAQKIDISQKDENKFMARWLAEREQAVPDSMHVHMMMMPGMLTPEQLAELDAARNDEFDRLFLTFMIQHHQGALTMVDTLLASPGAAQDSDIFRFITDVQVDQSAEIDVMGSMLEAYPGSDSR